MPYVNAIRKILDSALIFLFLLTAAAQAETAAVRDSTWATWPGTVYYAAQLSGPHAPYDGLTVHITAVNEYSLWINGERVDTPALDDNRLNTVDTYHLAGAFTDIFVAVEVVNYGLGSGNGLLVDIEAGPDRLGTTIDQRFCRFENGVMRSFPTTWYSFSGDITKATGKADWYRFDSSLFTNIRQRGFKPVQLGKIGATLNFTPAERLQVVAGFNGNVDTASTSGGGIALRKIDGENLAEKKAADRNQVTDGDLNAGYRYVSNPYNTFITVDLENTYVLTRLATYTGGVPEEWPYRSLRGFAAEISQDDFRWEEVGIIQEIGMTNADRGSYGYAEVPFPPQTARYIRCHVISERDSLPNVGEIMAYGTGYAYSGEYTSPWIDFGTPDLPKNFGMVTWEGTVPSGTVISVQTRTMTAAGVEGAWSEQHRESSFEFDPQEPAAKFRYRVLLQTANPDVTPVFKKLTVLFSDTGQPMISGSASVTPGRVAMNADTSFVYDLNYTLASGQNIETVVIAVPSSATVDSVMVTDGPVVTSMSPGSGFAFTSTPDSLYIQFSSPIVNASVNKEDRIRIFFRTRLLAHLHEFECGVFNSSLNDGAGPIRPPQASGKSWTVIGDMQDGVETRVPSVFAITGNYPNPFNPSTSIEFILPERGEAALTLFDSTGRKVRTLHSGALSPGAHTVRWDGRDDRGIPVSSGAYIVRLDSGGRSVSHRMLLVK